MFLSTYYQTHVQYHHRVIAIVFSGDEISKMHSVATPTKQKKTNAYIAKPNEQSVDDIMHP